MNFSIISGFNNEADECSVPLGFAQEFRRRGYRVKMYNTLNLEAKNVSLLQPEAWTDQGVKQLLEDANNKTFVPDVIFHFDFGLFRSPLLRKSFFPSAKWVCEAGDDPQCFQYNLSKISNGEFDLVHSPDIRCVYEYINRGINAVWAPHCANQPLTDSVEQQPEIDAVTTRNGGEPFFAELKIKLGSRFEATDYFLLGKEHVRHLKRGKIVVQNSKYKEITRRVFEGMMCNRLVITDRPELSTHIHEIFKEDEHIVYFDNVDQCVDKIKYYINNEKERLRIAQNGFELVKRNHTTSKRVDKLLELLKI